MCKCIFKRNNSGEIKIEVNFEGNESALVNNESVVNDINVFDVIDILMEFITIGDSLLSYQPKTIH